jgi:tRNA nucleotidyltransferase (CCA-adding enzyme)
MNLPSRRKIPEKIIRLAERVRSEHGRALLVGGCVRDLLIGLEPKDWDVEVYGVEPERLRSILDEMFQTVDSVGASFAVYKVDQDLEVSLPRRESKKGRGHRAFVIEGDPSMSVEEATRRRDFTINAILMDPLSGEIIDPFGGRADLEARILRVVSPKTFPEDSLRVLRAAQLAARYQLRIEPETIRLCQTMDLSDLPAERIWGEMEKLLLRAEQPSIGLQYLVELGAAHQLFPEIEALIGCPQDPEWHPEGDVFTHTSLVVDRAREMIADLDRPRQVTLMLAALCHDFGKPSTTVFSEGRWRSPGHDAAGVEPTERFLDRLKIFTLDGYNVRAQTLALVREHLRPGEFYKARASISDGAFRRLARRCELELLYRLSKADTLGRNAPWVPRERWFTTEAQDWFIQRARELDVAQKAPPPLLMGRHLIEMGFQPSPLFGQVLREVYEMQLDGRIQNLDEAKEAGRALLIRLQEEARR